MGKSAHDFFTGEQKEDIRQAIMNAELDTSGEIKVHIENRCKGDVMDRAAYIFKLLGIHKTEQRNGVLFYLALENRKFAILGDKGIHTKVPEDFWDTIKQTLLNQFRDGRFTEGLVEGITMAGQKLKEHFPHMADDVNELGDDVTFGDR
jgi:uncharacterized membrane protein